MDHTHKGGWVKTDLERRYIVNFTHIMIGNKLEVNKKSRERER